jgi:RNA-directed DNA polymerase
MSVLLTDSPAHLRRAFLGLKSRRDVAELLQTPYPSLVYYLYKASTRYTSFKIPKRAGGYRDILSPVARLKTIQRRLNQVLQAVYEPKPAAHGFIAERSILSNATPHLGQRFLLNVDLERFFPTINFGRVRGVFLAKPFALPEEVATVVAQICCYEGTLPQGAPTSPVVSNLVCRHLDAELGTLARNRGCAYTRYADDLTFSTNARRFPSGLARPTDNSAYAFVVGPELGAVITKNGFDVNAKKVRLADRTLGRRQEVTGLVINEKLNVRRAHIRQVRAMLNAWRTFGLDACEQEHHARYSKKHRSPARSPARFLDVVRGKIGFVGLVRGWNDRLYCKLLQDYADLLPDAHISVPSPASDDPRERMVESAILVLEGTEDRLEDDAIVKQGTAFLLQDVGVVTCAHVLVGEVTEAFRPDAPERRYRVLIKQRDNTRDLAVLELPAEALEGMTPLRRGTQGAQRSGTSVHVAGYPHWSRGDSLALKPGVVVQQRNYGPEKRYSVSAGIVAGMSGGPVIAAGLVVGVAVTGADSDHELDEKEHGVIPINALDRLGQA